MDQPTPPQLPPSPPPAESRAAAPQPPKPRRPWGLYVLIALLTTVVMLQSAYIYLSQNPTVQSVASAYGEVTSPEFLSELEDLLAMLNEPIGGLDPQAPITTPQQTPNTTPPVTDPDATAPNTQQPSPRIQPAPQDELGALGIDPNMSVNELLDSVLALGGLYDDAYGMLEDEPIIPQAPNQKSQPQQPNAQSKQPTAPSGLTHKLTEAAGNYRIEVPIADLRNFNVECVENQVVISGQRVRGLKWHHVTHTIPLAHAVDSDSMRVQLDGDTLVISVAKSAADTNLTPVPEVDTISHRELRLTA